MTNQPKSRQQTQSVSEKRERDSSLWNDRKSKSSAASEQSDTKNDHVTDVAGVNEITPGVSDSSTIVATWEVALPDADAATMFSRAVNNSHDDGR